MNEFDILDFLVIPMLSKKLRQGSSQITYKTRKIWKAALLRVENYQRQTSTIFIAKCQRLCLFTFTVTSNDSSLHFQTTFRSFHHQEESKMCFLYLWLALFESHFLVVGNVQTNTSLQGWSFSITCNRDIILLFSISLMWHKKGRSFSCLTEKKKK